MHGRPLRKATLILFAAGLAAAAAKPAPQPPRSGHAAPADTVPPAPPVPAAAPADTAPAPDGVVGGEGTEDDPWLIDVDDLLRRGYAVIVTPTDTVAVAGATTDTIRVTAPRLRVSEVVRRIGERMRDEERRMGALSVTQLSRVVVHHDDEPDSLGRRTEYDDAQRLTVDRDGEQRNVRVYRIERKYERGKLVEEKPDAEPEQEWAESARRQAMDMPFLLTSGGRYRYAILERTLIGEHLVFKIGFEPKDGFRPGIAGVVWIDYDDFVIRRMEGRLSGASPAPMFLADVPHFTWRQKREGDYWVTDELTAEIVLRKLPLLPRRITIRVALRDWDIRGPGGRGTP